MLPITVGLGGAPQMGYIETNPKSNLMAISGSGSGLSGDGRTQTGSAASNALRARLERIAKRV